MGSQAREADWRHRAACKGHPDPNVFFPDDSGDHSAALKLCVKCPVADECLQFGAQDDYGIFGRTTATHRKRLRAKNQTARAPDTCEHGRPWTEPCPACHRKTGFVQRPLTGFDLMAPRRGPEPKRAAKAQSKNQRRQDFASNYLDPLECVAELGAAVRRLLAEMQTPPTEAGGV